MENGQTVYKNRTLAHNLQQPAQETNFLSTTNNMNGRVLYVRLARIEIAMSSDNPGSYTTSITISPRWPGLD